MNAPYVDRYGLVRVPLLRGQSAPLWEGLGFWQDPRTGEMVRSVDAPKDGKVYSAAAWLQSTMNKWRLFGGTGNPGPIESRMTDPDDLTDAYWEMQASRWEPLRAFEGGWNHRQYAANLIKRFGINDRRVRARVYKRAEELWRGWAQEFGFYEPRSLSRPARA